MEGWEKEGRGLGMGREGKGRGRNVAFHHLLLSNLTTAHHEPSVALNSLSSSVVSLVAYRCTSEC